MALARDGGGGALGFNVLHFARLLRGAGLPIGTGRVLIAIDTVAALGPARRDDLYWALHAVFVNKREQRELFDQAFRLFWRDPEAPESLLELLLPKLARPHGRDPGRPLAPRLAENWPMARQRRRPPPPPKDWRDVDATLTWSDIDHVRTRDFEAMTGAELEQAKALLAKLRLPLQPLTTRRRQAAARGRLDLRATLRATARSDPNAIALRSCRRRTRPPALVVLCDISGSMARYSRMLLHFVHAVTNDRDRVHTFVFGTRLTNVTRHLAARDVDEALARVGHAATDWGGGTRITSCLRTFNRQWARRVLAQGAVVLLITDGLDREAGDGLAFEARRLRSSCRRLVWLNPLLRYEGFEPRAAGIRALLPHVDDFRRAHNVESLEDLARALG